MRETITTALDVLGLLLVTAGLVFFLWPQIGGGSLAIGGAVILFASALSDRPAPGRRRRNHTAPEAGR
jgi:drug/metabolite transporter (DMT)-like permease